MDNPAPRATVGDRCRTGCHSGRPRVRAARCQTCRSPVCGARSNIAAHSSGDCVARLTGIAIPLAHMTSESGPPEPDVQPGAGQTQAVKGYAAAEAATACGRTVRTGHVARRTTGSAVEPKSIRSMGFRPWMPRTIEIALVILGDSQDLVVWSARDHKFVDVRDARRRFHDSLVEALRAD